MKFRVFSLKMLMLVFLIGCTGNPETSEIRNIPTQAGIISPSAPTVTPFTPINKNQVETPQFNQPVRIFVPEFLEKWSGLELLADNVYVNKIEDSDCQISVNDPNLVLGEIVLALVSNFATVEDNIELDTIQKLLANQIDPEVEGNKIILTSGTTEYLRSIFEIDEQTISLIDIEDVPYFLHQNPEFLTFVPFENISPALKVLSIEGISPFSQDFNSQDYLLRIPVGVSCSEGIESQSILLDSGKFYSNRDPQKFTSVLMTGTTALVRATGAKMEINGTQYPGEYIKMWFDQADISHISNESSFWSDCPKADAAQKDTFFCSRPEYADLLTYLGVDVVELTGNHLLDKGVDPLLETFQILAENGIDFYAAGRNQAEAETPVRFIHNGNKIAFIGCNEAGPDFVWLQEFRPGVLRCDFDRMSSLVTEIVNEGFLPIVTYQYWESFQFDAMPYQKKHSYQLIDAGAVIVSGSQAHLPMSMDIYHNGFIHYGLGNLFFDQMDIPVVGTRREFIDRHIFYDGKYMGTQLLTALLEDYSQPRPMSQVDRSNLLLDAFEFFQYIP